MKVYHSSKIYPQKNGRPVVALGNFDGVHRAHQAMFTLTHQLAKKFRAQTLAYTFEPHPVHVLSEAAAPPLINTLEQKINLLADQRLDTTILEPFDKNFAGLSARQWFEEILVRRLHAQGVVVGYDFTFGKKREGTIGTLAQLTQEYNIKLEVLPAQMFRNTLISSSQIRHYVQAGEVKKANDLLGRNFFIEGKVIQGAGRGETIGIPTANLATQNELLPARGVYVGHATIFNEKNKRSYGAVTNIGVNPTFTHGTDIKNISIEAHLFHFKQNIYGKNMKLEFLTRLRHEKTFSSPQKLVTQIHRDMEKAKKILEK